jgi:hypothetical protein
MSDWPKVWVLFVTYKRTETAVNTARAFSEYLVYPNLHYHICDDGSGETDDGTGRDHVQVLMDTFREFYPGVTGHSMSTPPGQFDFGGCINEGVRLAIEDGADIQLVNVDDMQLLRTLDIRPHVDVLDSYGETGYMRLSWATPGISGVCTRYDVNRINEAHIWLRIIRDWSVNNPWRSESFVVSMQPFIAHKRFYDAYGHFREHINPGETESEMSGRYIRHPLGENGPQILHHIGDSWGHTPYGHMTGRANYYAKV